MKVKVLTARVVVVFVVLIAVMVSRVAVVGGGGAGHLQSISYRIHTIQKYRDYIIHPVLLTRSNTPKSHNPSTPKAGKSKCFTHRL